MSLFLSCRYWSKRKILMKERLFLFLNIHIFESDNRENFGCCLLKLRWFLDQNNEDRKNYFSIRVSDHIYIIYSKYNHHIFFRCTFFNFFENVMLFSKRWAFSLLLFTHLYRITVIELKLTWRSGTVWHWPFSFYGI